MAKKTWKKITGISQAQRKISRATGIPLSKSGRQRKIGKGLGCCIMLVVTLIGVIFVIAAVASVLL